MLCNLPPMQSSEFELKSYAEDVFNIEVMRKYLAKKTAEELLETIQNIKMLTQLMLTTAVHIGQILCLNLMMMKN